MTDLLPVDFADTPAAVTPPPVSPTREWTARLIGLLARLEHTRMEFAGLRLVSDADAVVGLAEAVVQATEDLARDTDFPDALAETQTLALAKAGAFFTALNGLKKPATRSLFASVFTALARTNSNGPTADDVRECLLSAADALGSYFKLFTERFRSSAAARGWVDAATAYLSDFKQLATDLPDE